MHALVAVDGHASWANMFTARSRWCRRFTEARLLRKLAKEHGVVTQMGNQGSAEDGLRRAVEVVQAGLIGPVREVHVWSNRPIWPQGMDRPAGSDPVPDSLNWDTGSARQISRPTKRPGPKATVEEVDRRGLSTVHMARLAGFRYRRAGRHGVPHLQHAVPRVQTGLSRRRSKRNLPAINKETYPLKSKIRFRVSRARRSAGRSSSIGMTAAIPSRVNPDRA